MAKNSLNNHRIGAVKNRSQVFNPLTNQFIKRDTTTGKFISCSDKKYKGVEQEKNSNVKNVKDKDSNPNIIKKS